MRRHVEDVFIADAVRTPIGRLGGALAATRPDDLAATTLRELVSRSHGLTAVDIDEVFLGNANGAGEDNRNVGRMAALLAGFPTTVPGASVNRLCGSGMEAVIAAGRALAVGDADVVVAGGVESMSRAPWVLQKPERAFPTANQTVWNTALGWRMVNPAMPPAWTISLGSGAEVLADRYSITRDDQDEFALGSHRRAAAAWAAGHFDSEVVAVPGTDLERDESIRPDTSRERLAALRPVFRDGGSVTAGNSSPMNDGAAALLLGSAAGLKRGGLSPMARLIASATAGVEPHLYGIGPVEAAREALRRAGLSWDAISAIELNEAFAAQALACLADWPDLDRSIVNPVGGAIAVGHPLGCSGARILTTLVHHLVRTGGRYGLAAMCIGVGQGIAVIVENCGNGPPGSERMGAIR